METTYKIIGGDGREYGPVSLEELKGWIRDGRVGRQTQILRNDLNSWLAASQYQELQPEIALLKETNTAVTKFEPVGFWIRLAAMVIDVIAFSAIFYVVGKLMGWDIEKITFGPNFEMENLPPYFFIIWFSVRMLYEGVLTGRFGATLGKMAVGAKIVKLDGAALSYPGAFLRTLVKIVGELLCYIGYIISTPLVIFGEDKRALHDLVSGTRVIYKR